MFWCGVPKKNEKRHDPFYQEKMMRACGILSKEVREDERRFCTETFKHFLYKVKKNIFAFRNYSIEQRKLADNKSRRLEQYFSTYQVREATYVERISQLEKQVEDLKDLLRKEGKELPKQEEEPIVVEKNDDVSLEALLKMFDVDEDLCNFDEELPDEVEVESNEEVEIVEKIDTEFSESEKVPTVSEGITAGDSEIHEKVKRKGHVEQSALSICDPIQNLKLKEDAGCVKKEILEEESQSEEGFQNVSQITEAWKDLEADLNTVWADYVKEEDI